MSSKHIYVNAVDLQLRTPLHWAATFNQVSVIELLLKNGARLDARDAWGTIPVELAVARGNLEASEILRAGDAGMEVAIENRQKLEEEGKAPVPKDPKSSTTIMKMELIQVADRTASKSCTIM